jgi:large subunit ribosomal protein L24
MKIKKGDNCIVTTGKDKGKTGVILRAFPKTNQVLIEGVNVVKRHQKSRRGGQKGQVVEKSMPISASNVMVVDPKKSVGTRISITRENGKRIRIAKKSGAVIGK